MLLEGGGRRVRRRLVGERGSGSGKQRPFRREGALELAAHVLATIGLGAQRSDTQGEGGAVGVGVLAEQGAKCHQQVEQAFPAVGRRECAIEPTQS
ncbi:hypothetical protein HRbin41_01074 [bacterium HR41]|nr:hypothetical protein HRbin41_01074 [bacterium HR41]